MTEERQPHFEDIHIGDQLPGRECGPYTVVDGVRWAGFQENWAQLHYDRDYARAHSGVPSFIASGAYRQALLIVMLTDWIGARGTLRRLTLRHVYPTHEGDLMRFSGTVTAKSPVADDSWIACDVAGYNQDGRQILTGQCVVELPSRAAQGAR